jgi:uncharacterized membrane protein
MDRTWQDLRALEAADRILARALMAAALVVAVALGAAVTATGEGEFVPSFGETAPP